MDVVYKRVCGMDIHKKQITACIMVDGKKEFVLIGTTTSELLDFCGLLKEMDIEMSAMESTASYWKPIWNVLEVFELPAMLVNAQHVKNVPGRKTDIKDAEWIADLLMHGLLKPSFVPSREHRELREIVRYRTSLVEERAREFNRLDKVLQGANIKLSSVASTLRTKSGMDMVKAISEGVTNPNVLAAFALGRMKSKTEELKAALNGLIQGHQRMILQAMLTHIESLDKVILGLDEDISGRLDEYGDLIKRLEAVPGVGRRSAEVIIAEIGTDMSQFPSAEHLASWAGMCPGVNKSAGKNRSGKTRQGNATLKKTVVQCAKSASRTKNTYLSSQYKRIAARRGANRATVAVGHSILKVCYHLIRDGCRYVDLGDDYFNRRNEEYIVKSNKRRLELLGYKVTLEKDDALIVA